MPEYVEGFDVEVQVVDTQGTLLLTLGDATFEGKAQRLINMLRIAMDAVVHADERRVREQAAVILQEDPVLAQAITGLMIERGES